MKYSDSDIIREYNRSSSAIVAAQTLGITTREIKRVLKRAGIIEEQLVRTSIDQKSYEIGIDMKKEFIDEEIF